MSRYVKPIYKYIEVVNDDKKLKALEIIKEKGISIWALETSNNVEQYNSIRNAYLTHACAFVKGLTQEEYVLLKEVLK